jgi:hypothetical protein
MVDNQIAKAVSSLDSLVKKSPLKEGLFNFYRTEEIKEEQVGGEKINT